MKHWIVLRIAPADVDIATISHSFGRLQCMLIMALLGACGCTNQPAPHSETATEPQPVPGPVIAQPGQDLQLLLDTAAAASKDRTLILRPGVYAARKQQFCLIALTARHDGVTILGQPDAILSGRLENNPQEPAVSHVVYCGDGLTSRTVLRGLTIADADGTASKTDVPVEDFGPRVSRLRKGLFFLMDGGAVKVFGQSTPTFEDVEFRDNRTRLCGGAVSIEQQGFCQRPVTFRNCRFVNNRCPGTGSAVDVLQGSAVRIDNCLFVSNIANYGMQQIAQTYQLSYNDRHGCGALTVFPNSFAWVTRSTFVQNWNGVDDKGPASKYEDCIFALNDASDGSLPGHPYELDIANAAGVSGCFFFSLHPDLRGTVPAGQNVLTADDPLFSEFYVPTNPQYEAVGFRP